MALLPPKRSMDPLVRAALGVQHGLARIGAMALACGFSAYLAVGCVSPFPQWADALMAVLFLASTGWCSMRWRRRKKSGGARLELELLVHLLVLAYALIVHLPGGLDGALYPLVYVVMMVAGAFARPGAAFGALAFAGLLEAGLGYASSVMPLEASATAFAAVTDVTPARDERFFIHALLLALFAFSSALLSRAEIARVRRLSRLRIQAELSKIKALARSYRLLGAPSRAPESGAHTSAQDEERLLYSGVDEIHQALTFALGLLRQALGLRTAILLGLDASGKRLEVQELSSDDEGVDPGPFSAGEGLCAAALAKGEAVALVGPQAGEHGVRHSTPELAGAVCAVPVFEHGRARGVLLVDRQTQQPFNKAEQQMLARTTHFIVRAVENERVFVQLERAKIEQGKLYRAAEQLAKAVTEAQVIEAGVSSAREFAAFDFAAVTLFDRKSEEHEICAVSGPGANALLGQRFRHNSGLVSMVVANRHPLPYRGNYDADRQVVFSRWLKLPPMPSLLVLPLAVHERAFGTLILGSSRLNAFGDSVRPTLEVLASHVAVSVANARMLKRLEELATTDGLTGLLNKRTLTEVATQKLKSATRFKKSLSLLICDIDHFKLVNDAHGHDIGDLVIRGVGELLKRAKRDTDVVGRFGGEEFVIVCEETDQNGAVLLAERIRSELKQIQFHTPSGPLHVACSVGVATFPSGGTSWEALFKATDEALYASKRAGRDRVTAWSPKLQGCAA